MRSGKWEVGSGKWEVGSGKWEVGSGKWEVGSGKCKTNLQFVSEQCGCKINLGIFHITSKTVDTFSEEQTHPRLSASRCSFKSVN
ncbi:MAG: hypothetical protein B6245_01425 [Desulfobacteraceae bacterium 4572_88]|nr:MAG: hypothetical protein B6245_01425 [Desulfobacteraceae bacterium 4572_88]